RRTAGAPRNVTSAIRRVRSNDTGACTSAALASTAYRPGPSGPVAGTTKTSATVPSATEPAVPLSVPSADAETEVGNGASVMVDSATASAPVRSPEARPRSNAATSVSAASQRATAAVASTAL